MKKIIIIFLLLLSTFICTWVVKAQTPINRPDSETNSSDYADGVWWVSDKEAISSEWILDPEIPDNYLPVPGQDELYMVIDNDGNIMQYRHRTQQEDGSWLWEDVNPNIPENYEAVEGLENVYKVTAEDGTVSYYKYVRNEDDTFAFVPVDEKGYPLENNTSDASVIPENYRRVTGNIYAVLNEYGVVIGYKERRMTNDGTFIWVDTTAPEIKDSSGQTNSTPDKEEPQETTPPSANQTPDQSEESNNSKSEVVTQQGSDGTYTQTETLITTETAGGWVTTYQVVITRVYNERGVLISTKKSDPVVLSRVKAGDDTNAPDPSKIAATLSEEYGRVSVGINYKTNLATEVLALLNEEREAEGLAPLQMNTGSDAYKLAMIRAADMAIYDHSDFDSPTYGLLSEMMTRFGISSAVPSENTWKTTTSRNAGAIHARFMVLESARKALMNPSYTQIGIGIVQKNGYYYICEIMIG